MSTIDRIRRRIIDSGSSNSLVGRARGRRWQQFLEVFPDLEHMDVVDLGGRTGDWLTAPVRPRRVTIVNLVAEESVPQQGISAVQADACELPARFRDVRFDLVFSNSLIEHVGGHARRVQLARTVASLGDRHWVQTPYRYFPIEPHWLFPGLQFLPHTVQASVAHRWPLPPWHAPDHAHGLDEVLNIELLSRTAMQYYFPDSELWFERFAGLPKSLVALKRGAGAAASDNGQ